MKATEALAALGDYASGQWAMVTTAQARQVGLSTVMLTRLVEQGMLLRLRYGVYAIAAAGEPEHAEIKAAWLGLKPAVPAWERSPLDVDSGVISHRSATVLHQLGDLTAAAIDMIVPRRRNLRDPTLRLRQRTLAADDVTLVAGLPCTTIARTVLDLLQEHTDASHVAPIIHEASRDGRLDLNQLAPRLGHYSRRYGIAAGDGHALLDHLLSHVNQYSPSERVLAALLRSSPAVHQAALTNLGSSSASATQAETPQLPDLTEASMAPVRHMVQSATQTQRQHRDATMPAARSTPDDEHRETPWSARSPRPS